MEKGIGGNKLAFYIQDPSYSKSEYLHEALISACVGNIKGGGAYAFASKDGIELLIEDENFKQFLKEGKFLLVVGMDDITNNYAIKTLIKLQEKYKGNLKVKAYIHKGKGSTFHPKYSWFSNENGGVLILGSGNLTQKGLRQNREAYTVEKCNKQEIAAIEREWNDWIEHSKFFLFDLDEEIVHERASRNTHRMKSLVEFQKKVGISEEVEWLCKYLELIQKQPKESKYTKIEKDNKEIIKTKEPVHLVVYDEDLDIDLTYWTISLEAEALIAEIPKSGSRWQQVNFDKETFEEFFGATCGENGMYRIILRNINHDGQLGELEVRPSVSVLSHNYRFELAAARGLCYPEGLERPLGVFVKVSPRDFLYELIMPDDEVYGACIEIVNSRKPYSANRMRRIRYIFREIIEAIPQLALQKRLDVD